MDKDIMPIWIGTSWKMNKQLSEAILFAELLREADVLDDPRIQPFVVPPFTAVREVGATLAGRPVLVGAQNMHWADQGPWTGEISPLMLKDCGATLVELGHAERRAHFGETDATVALKVEAAVRHGLTPLICIGETLAERDAGRTEEVLERQVRGALGRLNEEQKRAPLLLVYEPIWAIGEHGMPASPERADASQARIIDIATELLGRSVPCLYGGSVGPENCADLIDQPHIDGLFIGRSAWRAEGFIDILDRCVGALGR